MNDLSDLTPAGIQNPRIIQYLAIKKNTKSNPEHLSTLEGLWEVTTALDAGLPFRALFICPPQLRGDTARHLAGRIVDSGTHAYEVSAKVMERLSDRDDPDGLAAIVQLPHWQLDDIPLRAQNRVVVLDGLEIPGNVGTIIRCAHGTGTDAVILTNRRTRLSHPKVLGSSMGSSLVMPVIEAEQDAAIAWLTDHDFGIITTATSATTSYRRADYRGRVAAVMGSERYGIMQDWHTAQTSSVFIPMTDKLDSLNVGNAAVLLLYEMFYQQDGERF